MILAGPWGWPRDLLYEGLSLFLSLFLCFFLSISTGFLLLNHPPSFYSISNQRQDNPEGIQDARAEIGCHHRWYVMLTFTIPFMYLSLNDPSAGIFGLSLAVALRDKGESFFE